LFLLVISAAVSGQTVPNVVTYHNDSARTGQNQLEVKLTPANVKATAFGKVFSVPIDGWAMAQPLYLTGLTIGSGTHNVVYVATINNSVYAFDGDNGSALWHVQYETPTSYAHLCHDSNFQLSPSGGAGIVGTPVIDPVKKLLYFVTKTGDGSPGKPFALKLHAVSATTGVDQTGSPVAIIPQNNPTTFLPQYHMARPGMALSADGQTVYVALGSTGCQAFGFNNHGWVFAYQTGDLTQKGVFVDTPGGNGAAIWQSGAGIAMDSAGKLYVETGDGPFDASPGPGADYGDSVLKLSATADLADYFTPFNQKYLLTNDLEPGSSGPLVIDNNRHDATVPHLLIGSGKVADVYVMNRNNLGGYCSSCQTTNTNIVQQVSHPSDFGGGVGHPPNFRYGAPAFFNAGGPSATADGYVYFPTNAAAILSYPISNGVLATTPVRTPNKMGDPGAPSISSNGTSNGIVWVVNRTKEDNTTGTNTGTLLAYDAVTLAMLYTSDQASGGRDTLGAVGHFIIPTIVNGMVYVATQAQLVAYGAPPTPVALSPPSISFGAQVLGSVSGSQAVTLTNHQTTTLGKIAIGTAGDFAQTNTCGTSLNAGSSCTIQVTFAPSTTGIRTGSLAVTSNRQIGPLNTALAGSGVLSTTLMPASASFGPTVVGTTSGAQSFTFTNYQSVPVGSIAISISGNFSQTNTCGTSLAAHTSCTISVTFKPPLTGTQTGTLTVASDAPNSPVSASLQGTGVPPVKLAPSTINFGNQVVGTTSAPSTLTLTNYQSTTLGNIAISISGDFSFTTQCAASLPARQSCTISVTFTPTAIGTRTGTVTVTSDSPGGPVTAALKGTGVSH
jgi:hypothetical protein